MKTKLKNRDIWTKIKKPKRENMPMINWKIDQGKGMIMRVKKLPLIHIHHAIIQRRRDQYFSCFVIESYVCDWKSS